MSVFRMFSCVLMFEMAVIVSFHIYWNVKYDEVFRKYWSIWSETQNPSSQPNWTNQDIYLQLLEAKFQLV